MIDKIFSLQNILKENHRNINSLSDSKALVDFLMGNIGLNNLPVKFQSVLQTFISTEDNDYIEPSLADIFKHKIFKTNEYGYINEDLEKTQDKLMLLLNYKDGNDGNLKEFFTKIFSELYLRNTAQQKFSKNNLSTVDDFIKKILSNRNFYEQIIDDADEKFSLLIKKLSIKLFERESINDEYKSLENNYINKINQLINSWDDKNLLNYDSDEVSLSDGESDNNTDELNF